MEEELKKYAERMQFLADKRLNSPVFNEGREHALILLKTIFSTAEDYIYIYCAQLRDELSGNEEYYEALENFKKKGKTLRIILSDADVDLNRNIFKLIGAENIRILKSEQKTMMEDNLNHLKAHFTLADDSIYRLEYDIENFKALASFNDKKIGMILKNAFEGVWNGTK